MAFDDMSPLFESVAISMLTGIQVWVDYPTPPDGLPKGYLIGTLEPRSNLDDLQNRFGDGTYRLLAVGAERIAGGGVRQISHDSKTIRLAAGIEATWTSQVEESIARSSPRGFAGVMGSDADGPRGMDDRFSDDRGEDRRGPSRGDHRDPGGLFPGMRSNSQGYGMSGMGGMGGGDAPHVVSFGDGDPIVLAQGLETADQQARIDQAVAERAARRESDKMNEFMMKMMADAKADADRRADAATAAAQRAQESMLAMLANRNNSEATQPARRAEDEDVRVRALEELIASQRRTIQDMEDRMRSDRTRSYEDRDAERRRQMETEERMLALRRENEDLRKKLTEADIAAMAAGGGLSGDKNISPEEAMQRKIAMIGGLLQTAGPLVMPMIQKMMGGGDPSQQQIPPNGLPDGSQGHQQ